MRQKPWLLIAVIVTLALAGLSSAYAQSGGNYDLKWYTIDNGGVTFSTGSGYQLGDTIGQPDAGMLNGGNYTLAGGFWWNGATSKSPEHFIYLPFVLRNPP